MPGRSCRGALLLLLVRMTERDSIDAAGVHRHGHMIITSIRAQA
jgi:hypothetical protein